MAGFLESAVEDEVDVEDVDVEDRSGWGVVVVVGWDSFGVEVLGVEVSRG